MIPVRVYVENFMSYCEGQELLFDGARLWILSGKNGSGKSTIFDAIRFALYDSHRANKNEDLINHNADSFTIEFDFRVDGINYRIRRIVHRRGNPTRQVLQLTQKEGKLREIEIPSTDKEKGFKKWVERTIGMKENTFTSCILLVQGESEKLLNVQPDKRYNILEQLVDLSVYKRLFDITDEYRKESEIQVKGIRVRLNSMRAVNDIELNAATAAFNQAKASFKIVDEKIEKLTVVREQSKQWEKLKIQIVECQKQLQDLQGLLARTEEIEIKLSRFRELQDVLPLVKSVIGQRQRIIEIKAQVKQLQNKFQQTQDNLKTEESKRQSNSNLIEHIEKEIEQLEKNIHVLTTRGEELAPLNLKLSQIETLQSQLQEQRQKLTTFPENLEQLVQKAQQRNNQLVELESALPWLGEIAQLRLNLADALNREKTTSDRLTSLESQWQESQNQYEKISADLTLASEREKGISQELTRVEAEFNMVNKRRKNFEKAAHKPTCELCGQKINPEHIQKEKLRLDAEISTANANINNLKIQYQQAVDNSKQLTSETKSITHQMDSLQSERRQNETKKNQAKIDTQRYISEINKAYNYLQTNYQAYISPFVPKDVVEWLDTNYPTDADLTELRRELGDKQAHTNYLNKLSQEFDDWKVLNSQIQINIERLAEDEKTFPLIQAQQVRVEYSEVQDKKAQQQSELQEQRMQQHNLKNQLNIAVALIDKLRNELQSFELEMSKEIGMQGEIQRTIEADIENLPQPWQEKVNRIQPSEIEKLEIERQGLLEYEKLSNQLLMARGTVTFIEEQISNFNTQIDQLPLAAQRSLDVIELELKNAKIQRDEFDANRRSTETHFNELMRLREEKAQLEQDLQKAEREHQLYGMLSDILGKKGLQLQLLRNAEMAIVELANEILDSLSRGRMRLELRGEAEESPSESNKALDLQVYDYETGQKPIAVAMTSGSQRFRVAISLALAIGQYAGGARHIESVIIDEGFGSLDKNGRDDMIQELNQLQDRLARIILVSHLEDFSCAFSNGYLIELVNQASKVKLLEPV